MNPAQLIALRDCFEQKETEETEKCKHDGSFSVASVRSCSINPFNFPIPASKGDSYF
jgi:hypothetical protein